MTDGRAIGTSLKRILNLLGRIRGWELMCVVIRYKEREAGKCTSLPCSQVLDLRRFSAPEAMLAANTVCIMLLLHLHTYDRLISRLGTVGGSQQQ